MKIQQVVQAIDSFAPFSTAESWDNVGLLIGDPQAPVDRCLISLDCTRAQIDEALERGAQLILTHHPVIFSPLKRLSPQEVAFHVLRQGLSVLSAHTNLDVAPGGVNDCLAEVLGLLQTEPLVPTTRQNYWKLAVFVPLSHAQAVRDAMTEAGAGQLGNYDSCSFTSQGTGSFRPLAGARPAIGQVGEREEVAEVRIEVLCAPENKPVVVQAMLAAHPYETPAYDLLENHGVSRCYALGRLGLLPAPLSASAFAYEVKRRLNGPGVQFYDSGRPISRVAVCGGSGGSLLLDAVQRGADALVCGDLKQDVWLQARHLGISLIDAGHYATEQVVLPFLQKKLSALLPEVDFLITQTEQAPMQAI